MSFVPNSRFMNELLVIWPTQPGRPPRLARAKNCAMNGTVSAYVPLQTSAIFRPVDLVEGLVLGRDVGRVAHDDVVAALFQDGQEQRAIFCCVREGHVGGAVAHAGEDVGVGAVDEGVTHRQVEGERWGGFQGREAGCLQRGDGEAEAGDGDGEGVEVDAVDRVERRLDPGLKLQAGGVPVPPVQEPVKSAEQEVTRTAGRVDQLEPFERPLPQRRFQRPVEDELLHEDRRLPQRVGLLCVLGKVLVQVPEEPRGQRRVRRS